MGKQAPHVVRAVDEQPERVNSSSDLSSTGFEKISLHSGRSSPTAAEALDFPALPVATQQPAEQAGITAAANPDPEPAAAHIKAASSPVVRGDPLKELEEAAAEAVATTKEAAQQATQKLMKGAAEAKKEISSFVSSLWSAFDAPSAAAATPQGSHEALRSRLGLAQGEAVLETFRCKLIQPYEPVGNSFTPRKNIAFSGQLHIATASLCFEFDGASSEPVKVSAPRIRAFSKEGDAIALQVDVSGKGKTAASMVLGGFALPALEVDSALALLEHLTSTEEH